MPIVVVDIKDRLEDVDKKSLCHIFIINKLFVDMFLISPAIGVTCLFHALKNFQRSSKRKMRLKSVILKIGTYKGIAKGLFGKLYCPLKHFLTQAIIIFSNY